MWEDVEGQENFPVSAGFYLITHRLSVQEHNYSATTNGVSGVCWGGGGGVLISSICLSLSLVQ